MKRRIKKIILLLCIIILGGTSLFSVSSKSEKKSKNKTTVTAKEEVNVSDSVDFVSQFEILAQKLLQDPKKGNKATYAFLDFNTDNKNLLVEKYITDALTEAVFNTGKVKIIERDNLEKIINEQKFQSSGLVDETQAANIGNIAGVEYVCYGTIKEIDNGYTVNARVVDVETGEICAMSRTNVTKDSYLAKNDGISSVSSSAKKTVTPSVKKTNSSLWTCISSRNDFDEYTTYTFILKGPQNEFLFMGYDKYDVPSMSKVRAGYSRDYWSINNNGEYDFKTESKGTISKNFFNNASWSKKTGWKGESESFGFTYDKNGGAKFFINLFEENNYLTVRRNGTDVRRFQTQGFWETVESYGISREEIQNAIANEEF